MSALRYGTFSQPGMVHPLKDEGHQFGMYASSQGHSRALLHASRADSVLFVCSPLTVDTLDREVAEAVKSRRGGAGASPTTASVEHLIDFVERGPRDLSAWLDVGGDTVRPHRFRRRVGGSYPIGVVQHSVSYGYALHSWFLPLLLGDVRECDSVLCTSSAAKESIRKVLDRVALDFNREHGTRLAYRGRLDVVPLGVDADHFKPLDKAESRKRFKIPPGDKVILWSGRISAQDKADLVPFLRVFRDLCAMHPDLRIVLAGASRGDEIQTLGKVASDLGVMNRVTALGLVPRGLLPALYSASDVFVSLADSLPETFGLTVVEAMACGVPVVASDWNGYKDTIVHGQTGFLVKTSMLADSTFADDLSEWSLPQGEYLDPYAMAQATVVDMAGTREVLTTLLGAPALRASTGAAGRRRVEAEYAWPVVMRRIDDLFEELQKLAWSTPSEHRPYSRTALGSDFAQYPTRLIGDDVRVRRTAVPVVDWRRHYRLVDERVVNEIVSLISGSGERTLADIVQGVSHPRVRFHVAWMLKQGFLEVVS